MFGFYYRGRSRLEENGESRGETILGCGSSPGISDQGGLIKIEVGVNNGKPVSEELEVKFCESWRLRRKLRYLW